MIYDASHIIRAIGTKEVYKFTMLTKLVDGQNVLPVAV